MTKPILLATAMIVGMTILPGCNSSLLHNLQPHRLHRLNRGPAPSGSKANFSIPAEEPSAVLAEAFGVEES